MSANKTENLAGSASNTSTIKQENQDPMFEQESEQGDEISEMLNEAEQTPDETSLFDPPGEDFDYDEKKEEEPSFWLDCMVTAGENLYQGLTFLLGPSIADTLLDAVDYYEHFFMEASTEPSGARSGSRSRSVSRPPSSRNSPAPRSSSSRTLRRSQSTYQ